MSFSSQGGSSGGGGSGVADAAGAVAVGVAGGGSGGGILRRSSTTTSNSNNTPMTLSQTPGRPTFRSNAVNAVAVIPLLSSDPKNGQDDPTTYSNQSFHDLMDALSRYNQPSEGGGNGSGGIGDDIPLVVPNSNLTRPGNWRYDNTPLKNFHWGYGCQRLTIFDGRPYHSRMAHDRLMNHEVTRNWIDLCPSRRTAAVIGVLNIRDCPNQETLKRAEQEWQQWSERYSTPPYEVTAHGRDFERDFVVQRLFVFDSFRDDVTIQNINLEQVSSVLGSSLVAFPPADDKMDLHMNIVINDLAVAIFQELEARIRESDAITQGELGQPLTPAAAKSRFFTLPATTTTTTTTDTSKEIGPQASSNLSLQNIASVVSAENKLAATSPPSKQPKSSSIVSKVNSITGVVKGSSSEAQLLTPLDDVWDFAQLNPKDAQAMLRREVGRREKFAADLSLLAGSPLDAYERYSKAAELCKTTTPDPLWYASALEGCAAAHIAMAEVGGFNVDQYLEDSFQLPEDIMACAIISSADKMKSLGMKQTMPSVIVALCDEALDVVSRHPKLSFFRADLLLKLAWYCCEIEDTHIRCQWGMGDGCYSGNGGRDDEDNNITNGTNTNTTDDTRRRWEKSSATQLNFLKDLKSRDGEDIMARNNFKRCQRWMDFMHRAVSCGGLDPVTRADVALRCASLCLQGLRPTARPPSMKRLDTRIQMRRKASFFAVTAAEAMSETGGGDTPDDRTSALWIQAAKLYSSRANHAGGGNYGWATLRASVLHARALQGVRESSEEAAVELLSLIGEIQPNQKGIDTTGQLRLSKRESSTGDDDGGGGGEDAGMDMSGRGSDMSLSDNSYIAAESVVSAARTARTFVRTKAQGARARGVGFFTAPNAPSSLLTVAQSKWADDEPIPPTMVPLADTSDISYSVLAMSCVWSKMKFDSCVLAQRKLIGQIAGLRKELATSTLSASNHRGELQKPPPIRIASAVILKSDSHPEIERVKVKSAEESQGAMATFFNPYANKKKKGEVEVTLVAEGEERYVLMEFVNHLSVPLEIPRCELEFNTINNDRIKAPAISFVIPGQTNSFAVQFPFIILKGACAAEPKEVSSEADGGSSKEETNANLLEVKGLHVTCLGRTFFLPVEDLSSKAAPNLPKPAHLYPRRDYDNTGESDGVLKAPRLEIVPSQPNLLVSFATSPIPIEESTVVPVPLADGEVFTVPSFRLINDPGPNGRGRIEELRITAHGLPGQSETALFDLKPSSNGNETEEVSVITKKSEAALPLVLVAGCDGIDHQTLNSKEGTSTVTLQLSATHDLGAHSKGCTVKIRFRYRGGSSSPGFEMWRTRTVQLRVIRVKGPRISSLTFRPDLSWESGYSDLCKSLARQNKDNAPVSAEDPMDLPKSGSTDDEEFVLNRLGMDNGVHVCSDSVVVLLSIANETNAGITLSNSNGLVGGFPNNPIETIRVSPGVSTKIPMVIQRVDRSSNICDHLMAQTSLNWESEIMGEAGLPSQGRLETGGTIVPVNRRVRRGHMKMPVGCLKTIIDENPTFLSRICKAPCNVEVRIDGQGSVKSIEVAPGKPLDPVMSVEMATWVPDTVWSKSRLTFEFCCASSRDERDHASGGGGIEEDGSVDYAWVGQIRKSLPAGVEQPKTHNHRARIVFLHEGHYIVSACVNMKNADSHDGAKEIWWAREALHVHVKAAPLNQ